MEIWRFRADCNKDLVIRSPIDYFKDNFIARKMGSDWPQPAYIEIQGKSKWLRDFVSWMNSAPVLSKKAVEALEPLIGQHCEILPLIELRGKPYYALNVLTTVDCLDKAASNILYATDDSSHILAINSYKFIEEKQPLNIPIFKIPDDIGCVFVTRSFIDAVIANGLRGVSFEDPAVNPFSKFARGESLNVVPGLPE